jgi:chorismate mutase
VDRDCREFHARTARGLLMTDPNPDAQAKIDEIRQRIDAIDCQLVKLLNERAQCSLDIRALKPEAKLGLYDPKREEEIFSNVAKCNDGPMYSDDLREIYEAILHVAKEMRG